MQHQTGFNEQEGSQRDRHLFEIHNSGGHCVGVGRDEQVRREVSFTKGRIIVRGKLVTRGKVERADYILYYKPTTLTAVN